MGGIVTKKGLFINTTATIEKVVCINNNSVIYQVDSGLQLQPGLTVSISGCITSGYNGSYAIVSCGTFLVPNDVNNPSPGDYSLWTGFSTTNPIGTTPPEIEVFPPCSGAEGNILGSATVIITQASN